MRLATDSHANQNASSNFKWNKSFAYDLNIEPGTVSFWGVDFAPRPAEVHPLVLQICTSSPFILQYSDLKIDLWICLGSFFVAYLIALVLTRLRSPVFGASELS